jgi:hypothetical protein
MANPTDSRDAVLNLAVVGWATLVWLVVCRGMAPCLRIGYTATACRVLRRNVVRCSVEISGMSASFKLH